ncbi:ankyrin repeat-containing domain protein [Pyronema domesticum]|nr:ankyrin repeat-containing domain protein [Pyronema domesticum]
MASRKRVQPIPNEIILEIGKYCIDPYSVQALSRLSRVNKTFGDLFDEILYKQAADITKMNIERKDKSNIRINNGREIQINNYAIRAVQKNRKKVLERLLDLGVPVNTTAQEYAKRDAYPKSLLHYSVDSATLAKMTEPDTSITALLLDKGAEVNREDNHKCTPLHIAVQHGAPSYEPRPSTDKWVTLLLQRGANPNLTEKNGDTPLHMAAFVNNKTAIPILIKGVNGVKANRNARNEACKTPLQVAEDRFRGDQELHRLLKTV